MTTLRPTPSYLDGDESRVEPQDVGFFRPKLADTGLDSEQAANDYQHTWVDEPEPLMVQQLELRHDDTGQLGSPLVMRRNPDHSVTRFAELESWVGVVLSVEEDAFVAELQSNKPDTHPEEAEFGFDEVGDYDRDLVTEGSIFYWTIGYRQEGSGPRRRTSMLVFRRLPAYSASELVAARDRARALKREFGWD